MPKQEWKFSPVSDTLVKLLFPLIPQQIRLGCEAAQRKEKDLAYLIACQVFDVLDWARLNLRQCDMSVLVQEILCDLGMSALQFDNLQQLEDYVERNLVDGGPHVGTGTLVNAWRGSPAKVLPIDTMERYSRWETPGSSGCGASFVTAWSIVSNLAALRELFNWLVVKQVVPENPALLVNGPKFSRQVGITPIMQARQNAPPARLHSDHASNHHSKEAWRGA